MIYTVTLNPAIDKILFLEDFHQSKTNRLQRTIETIGGKGTHVSINLQRLGVKNVALGVVLGETGERIGKLLRSMGVEEKFLTYQIGGLESRTNYELVETRGSVCTMMTEKGPLLPKFVTDDLTNQIKTLITEGDNLVLTGDASNVEDQTIYSQLTRFASNLGAKVFLDASGRYLREGLESSPFLIKPNLEELCYLSGKDLKTMEEIVTAMRELDRFKIPIIAMTWSGKGAIVKYHDDTFRVHPVDVNVVNEAGCGDAFLASIVAGVEAGMDIINTLKNASAVAAATAESELTVGFDPSRARDLLPRAKVEKIPG